MKVLLTLDFPPQLGGIQNYLSSIVRHTYTPSDHVVVGASSGTQTGYAATIHVVSSVCGHWYQKCHLIAIARAYARLIKSIGAPIVTECGNMYTAIIPWLFRKPYRVYVYGTELCSLRRTTVRSLLLRHVLSRAERIYALGTYSTSLLQSVGVSCTTEIVPPRIDLDLKRHRVAIAAYAHTHTMKNPLTVLSIGRLVAHKGFDLLFDACADLPPETVGEVIVVGSGPEKSLLLKRIQTLGLQNRAVIKEQLSASELENEFAASDIFVLASRRMQSGTEGFGIVLLEAMSHGVPVVGARSGGIPEVIGDAGLLFDEGNREQLSQCLVRLHADPALRMGFSELGARRLREHYVW